MQTPVGELHVQFGCVHIFNDIFSGAKQYSRPQCSEAGRQALHSPYLSKLWVCPCLRQCEEKAALQCSAILRAGRSHGLHCLFITYSVSRQLLFVISRVVVFCLLCFVCCVRPWYCKTIRASAVCLPLLAVGGLCWVEQGSWDGGVMQRNCETGGVVAWCWTVISEVSLNLLIHTVHCIPCVLAAVWSQMALRTELRFEVARHINRCWSSQLWELFPCRI